MQSLTVRAATIHDIPAVADLMVQLYNAELPGAFRGEISKQQALMRYVLEANNYASLHGRFVGVVDGRIVGMANIQFPSDGSVQRAPAGTLRQAFAILGWRNGLHLTKTLLRSLISIKTKRPPQHAYIHGVAVDADQRGRGYGHALMQAVEQHAQQRGMRGTFLQVVLGNDRARALYQSLGYVVIDATPPWVNRVAIGSETLSKTF